MERKLPDWLEEHIANKKAKADAAPLGSPLTTPSSSQSSEEDGTFTRERLIQLENRLFQHVDPDRSPSSSQDPFCSQESGGSVPWSDTSLGNDFNDDALAGFVCDNLSTEEICKTCAPYQVFSKQGLKDGDEFRADLRNGLRDHLFVCYRLVLVLLDKIKDEELDGAALPLADMSNSPTKKRCSPMKAGQKRAREVRPPISCSARPLAP
jgi:hypothetical protein